MNTTKLGRKVCDLCPKSPTPPSPARGTQAPSNSLLVEAHKVLHPPIRNSAITQAPLRGQEVFFSTFSYDRRPSPCFYSFKYAARSLDILISSLLKGAGRKPAMTCEFPPVQFFHGFYRPFLSSGLILTNRKPIVQVRVFDFPWSGDALLLDDFYSRAQFNPSTRAWLRDHEQLVCFLVSRSLLPKDISQFGDSR